MHELQIQLFKTLEICFVYFIFKIQYSQQIPYYLILLQKLLTSYVCCMQYYVFWHICSAMHQRKACQRIKEKSQEDPNQFRYLLKCSTTSLPCYFEMLHLTHTAGNRILFFEPRGEQQWANVPSHISGTGTALQGNFNFSFTTHLDSIILK